MRKTTVKSFVFLLAFVLVAFLAVLPMQSGKIDRSDWMAALDDGQSLSSVTVPGTHDSGALYSIADVSGKCQTLSIKEQLKIGVRFLDIRLQLVDNKLRVVHSFVDQMTAFEDVLIELVSFVEANPSEFLLVSIKEDASAKNSSEDFTEALEKMLLSYSAVNTSRELPETVGAARGGIHVLARYAGASIGLPCYSGWWDDTAFALGDIYVQDNYCVEDAEEKITDIRATYAIALEEKHALVLNYTSCYLETGFPPIYAGLPAHDINADTLKALAEGKGSYGVVICDFITSSLADAIIGRNFK